MEALDGDRHAVVFDVNVYLNVAAVIGSPFTWADFDEAAIRYKDASLPNTVDRRIDSLLAIALCTSGKFAGPQPLEVWTSDHIDQLVEFKAGQPLVGTRPEDRGLGWSPQESTALLTNFVDDLVYDMSNGGSVGEVKVSQGCPPLSHEDGCVFATASLAAPGESAFYHRYLVTNDRDFRAASLSSSVEVFYPHEWIQLIRDARQAAYEESLGAPRSSGA